MRFLLGLIVGAVVVNRITKPAREQKKEELAQVILGQNKTVQEAA
jgi:hypothetical protein